MRLVYLALFALILSLPGRGEAQIELGEEYSNYGVGGRSNSSKPTQTSDSSALSTTLLYIPNRILDALDIIRFDVGIGLAYGGVVRITEYGQFGYRKLDPWSLRIGLRGRRAPVWIERSSEIGAFNTFRSSLDRHITPAELGIGADLLLPGFYVGISLDEAVDFLGGIFTLDFKNDDLK